MTDKQTVDNEYWKKKYADIHIRLTNQIAELQEQFKHKEQEYEELRQYHNKCCTELKNEKQALLEKYNQVSVNFHNGDYCNTEYCSLLKAKEQECEKLRFPMPDTNYAILTKEEFEQLDQLKKTNEELQKDNDKLKEELEDVYDDCKGCPTCNEALYNANLYAKKYNKLKQTLEEIKEIAETISLPMGIGKSGNRVILAKQILQKISEVENEHKRKN